MPNVTFKALEWFEIADLETLPSPALLVYRDRVEENVRRMLEIAGGPARLRPHIKTHKMREMIELQLSAGITKFKCATIAEAELAAVAGVPDLLLAYQPVGPNLKRFAELADTFPGTKFSVIGDDAAAIHEMSKAFHSGSRRSIGVADPIEVFLDIDVGQHRTGIPPGPKAAELYRLIASLPGLQGGGLHAYDGHISDTNLAARTSACDAAFEPVEKLKRNLIEEGLPVPRIVAGGSPTFAIHARRGDVECSPGTCVFWDASYRTRLSDLDFLPAALVLTRVVSKPSPNRLCLDLGHKAVAAEMPHPRVQFLNLPEANAVLHSEEHLVVETANADNFEIGDCLYGLPRHICPTVALHSMATVIDEGRIVGSWKVAARDRCLTI